ncbi:MAG: gliding motility-associated C-terminal domain-containing protein [Bacteroidales bacterium]|jgi:gliding motility-associated-like protein|nr:gliding motility-associated C-terminal domain-containing protein [Bacteroidales bacterium]
MKKIFFLLILILPFASFTQVICNSHQGDSVATIIRDYFLGGGIEVSNVRFNGSLTLNSNQFGTFTNADTTGDNIRLDSGLVIATGSIQLAAQTASGSTYSSPASNSYEAVGATPLYLMLQSMNITDPLNDIGCLTMDFTTQGEEVSFKYVFASDEYPTYVCSSYNDAFGFFISGPFEEDNTLVIDVPDGLRYQNRNIAIVPGSDVDDPNNPTYITINTVNPGSVGTYGSTTNPNCDLSNSQYYQGSTVNNLSGYTIALETQRVNIMPCKKYKITMAICNVSDGALPSAVYLGANSFKTDEWTISSQTFGERVNDTTLVKGDCSSAIARVSLNRPATPGDNYTFQFAGNMVPGIDYELSHNNGVIEFNQGDTVKEMTINFLSNENDIEGEIKNLMIMSQYFNECTGGDTINIYAQVPLRFKLDTIYEDRNYCRSELPKIDSLKVEALNAIGVASYSWTDINGNPIGTNPTSGSNVITINANNTSQNNKLVIYLKAEDNCGREILDTLTYFVRDLTTKITTDKDKICEGDTITLTCTNATTALWSSSPADMLLYKNNSVLEPKAAPSTTTKYKVDITDIYGCKASDSIMITAYPLVKARMLLSSKKLTFINSSMTFTDQTVNGYKRYWDFGDGTSSEDIYGTHFYPNIVQDTFDVILIAYNDAMCADTAKEKVSIAPDFALYIPNSFMPNSNGLSSSFYPVFSLNNDYNMQIFNRWGEKVFETTNTIKAWNGKLKNGSLAPEGMYVYIIFYKDDDGYDQVRKGNLTLIKTPTTNY